MRSLKKIAVICAATVLVSSCGGGGRKMTGGKPPAPGQAQQVLINWTGTEWLVQLNGNPPVKPAQAKSNLGANGPTMFVVNIVGHPTATFKNSGALTVWQGNKSQPQPGIDSEVLGPIVTNNGKQLIFFDLNYSKVTLNYALHFNQPTVPSVDPIIENGGGNW